MAEPRNSGDHNAINPLNAASIPRVPLSPAVTGTAVTASTTATSFTTSPLIAASGALLSSSASSPAPGGNSTTALNSTISPLLDTRPLSRLPSSPGLGATGQQIVVGNPAAVAANAAHSNTPPGSARSLSTTGADASALASTEISASSTAAVPAAAAAVNLAVPPLSSSGKRTTGAKHGVNTLRGFFVPGQDSAPAEANIVNPATDHHDTAPNLSRSTSAPENGESTSGHTTVVSNAMNARMRQGGPVTPALRPTASSNTLTSTNRRTQPLNPLSTASVKDGRYTSSATRAPHVGVISSPEEGTNTPSLLSNESKQTANIANPQESQVLGRRSPGSVSGSPRYTTGPTNSESTILGALQTRSSRISGAIPSIDTQPSNNIASNPLNPREKDAWSDAAPALPGGILTDTTAAAALRHDSFPASASAAASSASHPVLAASLPGVNDNHDNAFSTLPPNLKNSSRRSARSLAHGSSSTSAASGSNIAPLSRLQRIEKQLRVSQELYDIRQAAALTGEIPTTDASSNNEPSSSQPRFESLNNRLLAAGDWFRRRTSSTTAPSATLHSASSAAQIIRTLLNTTTDPHSAAARAAAHGARIKRNSEAHANHVTLTIQEDNNETNSESDTDTDSTNANLALNTFRNSANDTRPASASLPQSSSAAGNGTQYQTRASKHNPLANAKAAATSRVAPNGSASTASTALVGTGTSTRAERQYGEYSPGTWSYYFWQDPRLGNHLMILGAGLIACAVVMGMFGYGFMVYGECEKHEGDPNCQAPSIGPTVLPSSASPLPPSASPLPPSASSLAPNTTVTETATASGSILPSISASPSASANITSTATGTPTGTITQTGTPSPTASSSALPQRGIGIPKQRTMPPFQDYQVLPFLDIIQQTVRNLLRSAGLPEAAADAMTLYLTITTKNNCLTAMHGANTTSIQGGVQSIAVPINNANVTLPQIGTGVNGTYMGGGSCSVNVGLLVLNFLNDTAPILLANSDMTVVAASRSRLGGSARILADYTRSGQAGQNAYFFSYLLFFIGTCLLISGGAVKWSRSNNQRSNLAATPATAIVVENSMRNPANRAISAAIAPGANS